MLLNGILFPFLFVLFPVKAKAETSFALTTPMKRRFEKLKRRKKKLKRRFTKFFRRFVERLKSRRLLQCRIKRLCHSFPHSDFATCCK